MINTFLSSSYVSFAFAVIYAVTIILIVVAVAFFTVLERKVMSSVQRRRGPNMAGVWGFLQALSDGSKLLAKEPVFVSGANYYIFLFAPIMLLTMSLTLWVFMPLPGYQFGVSVSYSFVVVFLFSALNSYAIILAGLASNSRYSLIGGLRAIAQLISYEIPLSVSLLTLFCIQGSYNLHEFAGSKIFYAAVAFPSIVIFAISLLAETNRTPFDLPEAEAELVAGYNLEYSSILFSLFFLAEYSNILLAASLLSLLFFSGAWFYLGVIGFCLATIYMRAILPRFTFSQLINLCWKTMFPASLIMLMFTILIMFFLNIHPAAYLSNDTLDLIDVLIQGDLRAENLIDSNVDVFKDSLKYASFLPLLLKLPGDGDSPIDLEALGLALIGGAVASFLVLWIGGAYERYQEDLAKDAQEAAKKAAQKAADKKGDSLTTGGAEKVNSAIENKADAPVKDNVNPVFNTQPSSPTKIMSDLDEATSQSNNWFLDYLRLRAGKTNSGTPGDTLELIYREECYWNLGNPTKIFIFFVVALLVVSLLVGINWVVINFRPNNKKNSPYECGFEPVGSPVSEFTPNFTAVALIFLIYDVEVLLTFPWAYSAAGHAAYAVITFFFFIFLMLVGLAYEVMDDSFNVV